MAGALVVALALVAPAPAATLNVLWYTGGVDAVPNESGVANYQTGINNLAASAPTAPISVHNTWNVTYWNGTGSVPAGSYNVRRSRSNNVHGPGGQRRGRGFDAETGSEHMHSGIARYSIPDAGAVRPMRNFQNAHCLANVSACRLRRGVGPGIRRFG
jgi:hypothetical protein